MKDKDQIEKEKEQEKKELIEFYDKWTNTFDDFTSYATEKFKYLRLDETWAHRILLTLLIDHIKITSPKDHYNQVKNYTLNIFDEDLFLNSLKEGNESSPKKNDNIIKLVVDNKKKPKK